MPVLLVGSKDRSKRTRIYRRPTRVSFFYAKSKCDVGLKKPAKKTRGIFWSVGLTPHRYCIIIDPTTFYYASNPTYHLYWFDLFSNNLFSDTSL